MLRGCARSTAADKSASAKEVNAASAHVARRRQVLTTAEALLQLPTIAKSLLNLVLAGSEGRNRRKGELDAWRKGKTVEANSREAHAVRGENVYFT
jgi:hypothetical protein